MSMKKNKFFLVLIPVIYIFISCSSVKNPKNITVPLDYSNYDVVESEIERIHQFQQIEPVKAMWRAYLLGNEKIIDECVSIVKVKLEQAIDDNDYFTANRYYTSLKSIGYAFSTEDDNAIQNLVYTQIPGLGDNNKKTPENMAQTMNATVTIWVDRGIKVENGAGSVDIVIGSGFFIDSKGYIVTNHHVIDSMVDSKYEGYSRLYVKLLSDKDEKIPAKVVGYDPILDLALLKVEIEPEYVLSLGSSSDLNVGDTVLAIGTPLGLEGTLTRGIVSTVDRKLTNFGNVFQIDAAINSGNSGGPLIDDNLRVQAIVFAGMLQFQGLNFAIPVEYLKQELPKLYNFGEGGEVIHPWIGCYGHTKRMGNTKIGVEIQYIMPGSSASLNGLEPGDVIYEFDNKSVSTLDDLQFLYMAYQTETMVKCKYLDKEENEKECYIYLEKRPTKPFKKISDSDFVYNIFMPAFGMKLIPSSATNRNTYKIASVVRGSSADQMSFAENDIIQIKDIKYDDENDVFYALINTQRQKKGWLDLMMTLAASYDSPFYF